MKTPPDIQVSSILYFLGMALRSDPEIQRWTEASPDEIVAKTMEHAPIEHLQGGKIGFYATQLPCLALSINTERFRACPGTNPPRGREFNATLWYLFAPFQSESAEIHGYTKGQRFSTLMWWRIQYWLKKQKLFTADAGIDEPSFDLQSVSKIRILEMNDPGERVGYSFAEGLKIPLKVWHAFAPYEEVDPAVLDLIALGITSDAGAGVGVSANVDVSAP